MDRITILCIIMAVVPLAYMLWELRHDIQSFIRYHRLSTVRQAEEEDKLSDYERILIATKEVEIDFQPNSGTHHSEEVYLNRARLLQESTHLYSMINSL